MIEDLIKSNRSVRRFYNSKSVDIGVLRWLVDLARLSASAANLQPLKYIISNKREMNEAIFPWLAWAGYLKDGAPSVEERPSAYIIVLGDTDISKKIDCDHGIAVQNILLGAVEKGWGGCIIGAIKREGLREVLCIPQRYEILLVIALGKPKEEAVIEEVQADGSIRYWRDEKGIHHVPKRKLEDIILDIYAE